VGFGNKLAFFISKRPVRRGLDQSHLEKLIRGNLRIVTHAIRAKSVPL